jgi:hypothetical protein
MRKPARKQGRYAQAMKNGKWKMENGKWITENGGHPTSPPFIFRFPLSVVL